LKEFPLPKIEAHLILSVLEKVFIDRHKHLIMTTILQSKYFTFRYCLILFIFCLSTQIAYTQTEVLIIKSKVIDSSNKNPVHLATIRVFTDDRLKNQVANIITDEKGVFSISLKLKSVGKIHLTVTHSSYSPKTLSTEVTFNKDMIEIPDIFLTPQINTLTEVIVKARRPIIETNPDGITFNVADDPSLEGTQAIEALRKTPFVSVSDNQITVNGKPTKVLLNGRSTGIISHNPAAALNVLPAHLIKRIEVITNPSAKYDAEGYAAIINIISKKIAGYMFGNGLHYETWNVSKVSVVPFGSVKLGDFGFSFNGGLTSSRQPFLSEATYNSFHNTTIFSRRTSNATGTNKNVTQWGTWELSWDLDSLTSLSGYGSINGGSSRPTSSQEIKTYNTNNQILTQSLFQSNQETTNPFGDAGLDLIKKSKRNKRQQFTLNTNWQWSNNKNNAESDQFNSGNSNRFIINTNSFKNRQFTLQSDFTLPTSATQSIDIGAKVIFRSVHSDYQSLLRNSINDPYKIDIKNTDFFTYNQQIKSMYLVYRFALKKTTIQPGVRFEQTHLKGDFITSQMKVVQDYTNLFPTLNISRNLGKGMFVRMSYTRRISRPGIKYLNPFVDNYDSLNIFYGNPALNPEIKNSYEAGFSISKTKFNISLTLIYGSDHGLISQFTNFDGSTGVTRTTYNNLVSANRFTLSTFVSFNGKKISGNLIFYGTYNTVRMHATNQIINEGISGHGNFNFSYPFSKKLRFRYNSSLLLPTVLPQGKVNGLYLYYLRFEQLLLDKKATLLISINNPFSKYYKRTTFLTNRESLYTQSSTEFLPYRSLQFGIILNFGKLKENVSRKKGVTVDDIKN